MLITVSDTALFETLQPNGHNNGKILIWCIIHSIGRPFCFEPTLIIIPYWRTCNNNSNCTLLLDSCPLWTTSLWPFWEKVSREKEILIQTTSKYYWCFVQIILEEPYDLSPMSKSVQMSPSTIKKSKQGQWRRAKEKKHKTQIYYQSKREILRVKVRAQCYFQWG